MQGGPAVFEIDPLTDATSIILFRGNVLAVAVIATKTGSIFVQEQSTLIEKILSLSKVHSDAAGYRCCQYGKA